MNTINLNLYNLLKTDFKLSDAKAKNFAQSIQEVVRSEVSTAATEYKSLLKEDLLMLELKLTKELSATKSELSNKINDQFKWFIGIFITLALMIIGLYFRK